jgi:hypothetical protein
MIGKPAPERGTLTQPQETKTVSSKFTKMPLFYWGVLCLCVGQLLYFLSICLSILRVFTFRTGFLVLATRRMLWTSGFPTTIGLLLTALDLALILPLKRRATRHVIQPLPPEPSCTVALTAYNDEASIYEAAKDFLAHPRVRRVIVVSNNSTDLYRSYDGTGPRSRRYCLQ